MLQLGLTLVSAVQSQTSAFGYTYTLQIIYNIGDEITQRTIEARGQTQFFIFIIFGMSSKLRVCSKYLIFGAWVLFLEQINISEVFKIVSRGGDKR